MRLKILALTCVMCLALFAGCSKEPHYTVEITPNPSEVTTVISTEDELYERVDGWADRLEIMASDITTAYDGWVAEEITKEEYSAEIERINGEMALLKKESDLKTEYELDGTDEEHLKWDNLLLAYDNAKNDLNSFLVLSQELATDEEVREMYKNRVVENFPGSLELIKEYVEEYSK